MAETSWYYYDWQMDGDPAEFAVDTRFFDKAPYENRPVLLHMLSLIHISEPTRH